MELSPTPPHQDIAGPNRPCQAPPREFPGVAALIIVVLMVAVLIQAQRYSCCANPRPPEIGASVAALGPIIMDIPADPLEKGITAWQQGHADQARQLFWEILLQEPDNLRAHFFLSKIYAASGQLKLLARKHFDECYRLNPQDPLLPAYQTIVAPLADIDGHYTLLEGHAFLLELPRGFHAYNETNAANRLRQAVLLENDRPLPRPQAIHEEIATIGAGRYSYWQEEIIFAASDNSDPNENGRRYTVVFAPIWPIGREDYFEKYRSFDRQLLAAWQNFQIRNTPAAITMFSDMLTAIGDDVTVNHSLADIFAQRGDSVGAAGYFWKCLRLDPQSPEGQAALEQLPVHLVEPGQIVPAGNFGYSVPVDPAWNQLNDTHRAERPKLLCLFENGRPLGPANRNLREIRQIGHGRFSHWKNDLVFSASDNSDPRQNGKIYVIKIVPVEF